MKRALLLGLRAWYTWRLQRHQKLEVACDAQRWYCCRLLAALDARPPFRPLRFRAIARLIREGW